MSLVQEEEIFVVSRYPPVPTWRALFQWDGCGIEDTCVFGPVGQGRLN